MVHYVPDVNSNMASSVSLSKSCTTPDSADDRTFVSITSDFLCRDDDEPSSDSSSALLPVKGTHNFQKATTETLAPRILSPLPIPIFATT